MELGRSILEGSQRSATAPHPSAALEGPWQGRVCKRNTGEGPLLRGVGEPGWLPPGLAEGEAGTAPRSVSLSDHRPGAWACHAVGEDGGPHGGRTSGLPDVGALAWPYLPSRDCYEHGASRTPLEAHISELGPGYLHAGVSPGVSERFQLPGMPGANFSYAGDPVPWLEAAAVTSLLQGWTPVGHAGHAGRGCPEGVLPYYPLPSPPRPGHGRRTSWRWGPWSATRWNGPTQAAGCCPPSPSTTSWRPTFRPTTTARPGTALGRARPSSSWKSEVTVARVWAAGVLLPGLSPGRPRGEQLSGACMGPSWGNPLPSGGATGWGRTAGPRAGVGQGPDPDANGARGARPAGPREPLSSPQPSLPLQKCCPWASSRGPPSAQASCSPSSSSPWCSSSTAAAKAVSTVPAHPAPTTGRPRRPGVSRRGWRSIQAAPPCPGRKDVTLRKLDIKVETVNREPLTMHSDREDDTASVSTATRVMKAIYSVRAPASRPTPLFPLLGPPAPGSTDLLPHVPSWAGLGPMYTRTCAHTCSTCTRSCTDARAHMHVRTSSPGWFPSSRGPAGHALHRLHLALPMQSELETPGSFLVQLPGSSDRGCPREGQ